MNECPSLNPSMEAPACEPGKFTRACHDEHRDGGISLQALLVDASRQGQGDTTQPSG